MSQTNTHLASYLNDHLAGAMAGLEMLEHITTAYANTDVGRLAEALRAEVAEDRASLQTLMDRLGIGQSRVRQAAGWVGEKLARLKIRTDESAGGPFHLMEALEAMSLGIEGKRLLWLSLAAAVGADPALAVLDYPTLIRRAESQRERVESWRRDAARAALSTKTP